MGWDGLVYFTHQDSNEYMRLHLHGTRLCGSYSEEREVKQGTKFFDPQYNEILVLILHLAR